MDEQSSERIRQSADKIYECIDSVYSFLCELNFNDREWDEIQERFDKVDLSIRDHQEEIYFLTKYE